MGRWSSYPGLSVLVDGVNDGEPPIPHTILIPFTCVEMSARNIIGLILAVGTGVTISEPDDPTG